MTMDGGTAISTGMDAQLRCSQASRHSWQARRYPSGVITIGMISNLLLSMLFVLFWAGYSAMAAQIPNVTLKFTVQRLQEGKLDDSYHVWRLTCDLGTCRLIVLTVGPCVGDAFYTPTIQTWSTEQGTLKVVNLPNNVLHLRKARGFFGEEVTTALIGYADPFTGMGYTRYRRVSSFSGAVVAHDDILKKVFTWELVPLLTIFDDQRVKLNCQYIRLPAIETLTSDQVHEMLSGDIEQGSLRWQQAKI